MRDNTVIADQTVHPRSLKLAHRFNVAVLFSDRRVDEGRGIWCSPFAIEAKLSEHANVLEAAVVGRADADGPVKPEAWLVLKQERGDRAAIERALVQHCKAELAAYKYPYWCHFVAELPKTATGKIQRFKLRNLLASGDGPEHRRSA